jgi:hypothetical protein
VKPSGEGRGLAASRAFADGLPAPASGKGGNFRYEPLCLIGIGIEVVADPFRELGMSLMSRILDGGEEFSVTPGATAVFGRATAGDFDEARIELSRRGIGEVLDLDCVLPTVTEVINVHQLLRADIFKDVAEPRLAGVADIGRVMLLACICPRQKVMALRRLRACRRPRCCHGNADHDGEAQRRGPSIGPATEDALERRERWSRSHASSPATRGALCSLRTRLIELFAKEAETTTGSTPEWSGWPTKIQAALNELERIPVRSTRSPHGERNSDTPFC